MKNYLPDSILAFIISFSLFALYSDCVSAQTSVDLRQGVFLNGLGGSMNDEAWSIIQTNDGGYAVMGYTTSYALGTASVYILKLDSTGILSWSKTIGGSGDDEGYSIIQTTDGGYAIAGLTNSFGAGGGDAYIIKLNALGDTLWTRTVGGTAQDWAFSIVQTSDGGYAVTGFTASYGAGGEDVYIIKLDAAGNVTWTKTIGGSGTDYGRSIVQTKDGGYIITGETYSFGSGFNDAYFVKLDSSGNLEWTKSVGGASNDYCTSIIQSKDGGYVAAGLTNSYGTSAEGSVYVMKLDTGGNLKWTKTIGGPSQQSFAYSILQAKDSTYMVAGYTDSYSGSFPTDNIYIIHLDTAGNPITTKTIVETYISDLHSIVQAKDGGYAAAGFTTNNSSYNYYILKLDSALNLCTGINTKIPSIGSGGNVSSGGIVTSPPSMTGHGGVAGTGGPDLMVCRILDSIAVTSPPFAAFESSDSVFCAGSCISFTNLSTNATSWSWIFPGANPSSSSDQNPLNVCYPAAGSYDVSLIATNSGGSDTIKSVNFITANPTPPAPVITFLHDTLFAASDPSYISYQWYDSTALLAGQADSFLVITSSGGYSVKVTNIFGCQQASSTNINMGIPTFTNGSPITISPNPVKEKFMIYDLQSTIERVEIYNIPGQVCSQSEIVNRKSEIEVDVSSLPAGIYFVQLKTGSWNVVKRFVKE